jgi:hypothetical protein
MNSVLIAPAKSENSPLTPYAADNIWDKVNARWPVIEGSSN